MHFFLSYMYKKIAFINMDINTVIIIVEKMQQNLRYFNLKILFQFDYTLWHHRILHCGIEIYL